LCHHGNSNFIKKNVLFPDLKVGEFIVRFSTCKVRPKGRVLNPSTKFLRTLQ